MSQEDMGFIASGEALLTVASTTISVFKVPDGGVTTPYNTFEPSTLMITNQNTTTDTRVDLYDHDWTNAETLAAGEVALFSAFVPLGTTVVYDRDQLLGLRFHKEVCAQQSVAVNCHVRVAGQLIL